MDKKEHKTFKVLHYMCIGTVLLSEWKKSGEVNASGAFTSLF